MGPRQAPADFHSRAEPGIEIGILKTGEADIFAGFAQLQAPEAEPMLLDMIDQDVQDGIGLSPCAGCWKELHDDGIGIQRYESLAVIAAPLPQDQPFGCQAHDWNSSR